MTKLLIQYPFLETPPVLSPIRALLRKHIHPYQEGVARGRGVSTYSLLEHTGAKRDSQRKKKHPWDQKVGIFS